MKIIDNGWIKVSDRKPTVQEMGHGIATYEGGHTHFARYHASYGPLHSSVTHWQPFSLPKPPMTQEQKDEAEFESWFKAWGYSSVVAADKLSRLSTWLAACRYARDNNSTT